MARFFGALLDAPRLRLGGRSSRGAESGGLNLDVTTNCQGLDTNQARAAASPARGMSAAKTPD